MAGNADLLIRIKSILESQGIDAANRELDQLVDKEKLHNVAATKAVASTGKMSDQLKAGAESAESLKSGLSGNTAGLARLTSEMSGFARVVGVASLSVGAFMGGWAQGKKIQTWLWKLATTVNNLGPPIIRTREEFERLDKVKLKQLKKEVAGITTGMTEATGALDRVFQREEALRSAEAEREVAEIEADMPAGPEREKQIARVRGKASQASANQRILIEQEKIAAAEEAAAGFLTRTVALENDVAKAKSALLNAQEAAEYHWSEARMNKIKETRNQLASAESILAAEIPKMHKTYEAINQSIIDGLYKIETVKAGKTTAGLQTQSQTRAADQTIAAAKQRAEAEARMKALEKQKETAQRAGEARIKDAEAAAQSAKDSAGSARGTAQAYSPTSGARGGSLARMKEHDIELDRQALQADARAKNAAELIRQLNDENRILMQGFADQVKQLREQQKNLQI